MAGDLGPARHVMRCRLLSGDDVLMMALCQCVLSSRLSRGGGCGIFTQAADLAANGWVIRRAG